MAPPHLVGVGSITLGRPFGGAWQGLFRPPLLYSLQKKKKKKKRKKEEEKKKKLCDVYNKIHFLPRH
jgi:hypothetical protein